MLDLDALSNHDTSIGFLENLLSMRSWERQNVPLYQPQIALDILLHSSACAAKGQPAKIKDIHLAIGHSQDRIREIIRELVNGDWLIPERDKHDGRARRVLPSPKCLSLLENYRSRLLDYLSRAHSSQ